MPAFTWSLAPEAGALREAKGQCSAGCRRRRTVSGARQQPVTLRHVAAGALRDAEGNTQLGSCTKQPAVPAALLQLASCAKQLAVPAALL